MRYLETSKPQLTINKYDPCNHGQNKQGIIKEVRQAQLGMFIWETDYRLLKTGFKPVTGFIGHPPFSNIQAFQQYLSLMRQDHSSITSLDQQSLSHTLKGVINRYKLVFLPNASRNKACFCHPYAIFNRQNNTKKLDYRLPN